VELVRRAVETGGVLAFRVLAKAASNDETAAAADSQDTDETAATDDTDAPGERWITYDPNEVQLPPDAVTRSGENSTSQVLIVNDSWNVTGVYLTQVSQDSDATGRPCISGEFSDEGAARMRGLTSEYSPDPTTGAFWALGIILDGHLISAPRIIASIGKRFQLTGSFSKADVQFLVAVLRAGRLPAKVKPESMTLEKVEPKR
jgi:preprotein translocase subunit SecD